MDTFESDVDACTLTIQQTVAASMIGVVPSDVINVVASAASASASVWTQQLRALSRYHPLAGSAITVSYEVSTYSSFSEESLQSQLKNAVKTGTFDTLLSSYATSNGATGLVGATSDTISMTSLSDDDTDDDTTRIRPALIALIAIGCIVAIVVIVEAVYSNCIYKAREPDNPAADAQL